MIRQFSRPPTEEAKPAPHGFRNRRSIILALALIAFTVASCQTAPHNAQKAALSFPPVAMAKQEYRIQPGDILESHYGLDPTLDQQALVAPDGRVAFRYLPSAVAAGLTLPQLRAQMVEQAGIVDSSFMISLRSSVGTRVYVTGEVNTPGEVIENGQISALQAISRAGGFKLTTQASTVILLRRDDENKAHLYTMNLNAAMNGSAPNEDVLLQAYDIVYVPRDLFGNVSLIFERIRNAVPISYSFFYGNSNGVF